MVPWHWSIRGWTRRSPVKGGLCCNQCHNIELHHGKGHVLSSATHGHCCSLVQTATLGGRKREKEAMISAHRSINSHKGPSIWQVRMDRQDECTDSAASCWQVFPGRSTFPPFERRIDLVPHRMERLENKIRCVCVCTRVFPKRYSHYGRSRKGVVAKVEK